MSDSPALITISLVAIFFAPIIIAYAGVWTIRFLSRPRKEKP